MKKGMFSVLGKFNLCKSGRSGVTNSYNELDLDNLTFKDEGAHFIFKNISEDM